MSPKGHLNPRPSACSLSYAAASRVSNKCLLSCRAVAPSRSTFREGRRSSERFVVKGVLEATKADAQKELQLEGNKALKFQNKGDAHTLQPQNAAMAPSIGAASASLMFQVLACAPAFAAEAGQMTDEEFFQGFLIFLGAGALYLFVAPPIIYGYLKLRWFKRNMPETFFQFMLMFLFFPAMLLWAPFINFRPQARDPSRMP